MKLAYYSGCSLHSSGIEYALSLRAVCYRLGIELVEIKDWVCCGSTPAHATSRLLSIALPLKNLAEVKNEGFGEVVVPCASCFQRFRMAQYEIENDKKVLRELEDIVDYNPGNKIKVTHPLEIFSYERVLETLAMAINKDMAHLKVVCYYGCLLTRPPRVMKFDECEYPRSMDTALNSAGIKTLDWGYKTDCCGATLTLTETPIVLRLCREILEGAKEVGANSIAVACPLCHANLDVRQKEIEEKYGASYGLPVLYFTQLIGLAFGLKPEELGLKSHFVSTEKIYEQ